MNSSKIDAALRKLNYEKVSTPIYIYYRKVGLKGGKGLKKIYILMDISFHKQV